MIPKNRKPGCPLFFLAGTLLLAGCGRDPAEEKSIHRAARQGDLEETQRQIFLGHVLDRDEQGNTALHYAAMKGHDRIARALLHAASSEIDARNKLGWTPLHLASLYGWDEIVPLLLESGAAVNAKSHRGWTPLHNAVGKGHTRIAKRLIEHGADVNASNSSGITPLLWVYEEQGDLVELLRNHGAIEQPHPPVP